MESSEFISTSAQVLKTLLEYVKESPLIAIEINPDGSQIRLDWQMRATAEISGFTNILRLVISGNPGLFYLSYTEPTANRQPVTEPRSIVAHNLTLQGVALANSQTLILYTNSSGQIEAGELYLTFTNYQLYDVHYGRINPENFLLRLKEQKSAQ